MKEKNGEHPFGDAGQLLCLVVFLIVWGADSYFLRWSTAPAGYLPLALRQCLLAVCLAVALALFGSAHAVTNPRKRPPGVISSGAFRYVRHPLYLASLLFYVGLTIATASLISLALLVPISAFYNHIAAYEETLLETKFGASYRRYRRNTGRWVPKLRG